jgi:hypothetical protein
MLIKTKNQHKKIIITHNQILDNTENILMPITITTIITTLTIITTDVIIITNINKKAQITTNHTINLNTAFNTTKTI